MSCEHTLKTALWRGKPVLDLGKPELLKVITHLAKQIDDMHESHAKEMSLMKMLR